MKRALAIPGVSLLLSGCGVDAETPRAPALCDERAQLPAPSSLCDGAAPVGPPVLNGPCTLEVENPGHLLVSTTDGSTGALSVVQTETRTVYPDVALGSSDGLPFYRRGYVFMLHRFGFDYIDLLDPCEEFKSLGEFPLEVNSVASPNPNSLAFRHDGLAFVSLFGAPYIQVLDLSRDPAQARVASIDTSAFADADGNPEMNQSITCGDTLFVSAQRLDPSWTPADDEILIPVDMPSCTIHPKGEISLLGINARQIRLDPSATSQHVVLILTTGLERVDLATGKVSWAVPESVFAAAGLTNWDIQAFAISGDLDTIWVAAWTPEYTLDIWRGSLSSPQKLERVIRDLGGTEKTLNIVGDELWIGDTSTGGAGMRVYDLSQNPPVELLGPLSTGLPPYSAIPVP